MGAKAAAERPDSATAETASDGAAWLVLAPSLPDWLLLLGPAASVRVTSDPRRFRDVLRGDRPRVVVCAEPPARPADIELLAAERRRRAGMLAVHLAPPEAVGERLRALALGFDDALSTAVPAAELVGRLRLLEHRERQRPASVTVLRLAGGLELDLAAHELRRGGTPVHLRPKEYALLALLATNPGRAWTRRQLLDRAWGPGHAGSERTVDVHVRWLRSKIEEDPERPVHLATVRGVGYRLDGLQR